MFVSTSSNLAAREGGGIIPSGDAKVWCDIDQGTSMLGVSYYFVALAVQYPPALSQLGSQSGT